MTEMENKGSYKRKIAFKIKKKMQMINGSDVEGDFTE